MRLLQLAAAAWCGLAAAAPTASSGGSSAGGGGAAPPPPASTDVLAFYYLWYGNPETDGRYLHWNHSVLPHWTPAVNQRYPSVGQPHSPPAQIHARFYPQRGCYSVAEPATLRAQMAELRDAGVGTVVLSWWGRPGLSSGDSQGVVTDSKIDGVLAAAAEAGVFVAWHMEPYEGRSAVSFREDVCYLNRRYGDHPALLRRQRQQREAGESGGGGGAVYFVYDSCHIVSQDWAAVFDAALPGSIRGTEDDGTFIGLWLHAHHGTDLSAGHFDGAYTYFASVGFSWGATLGNWKQIHSWAEREDKIFVASVGPGYNDEGIRPWNAHNTKPRGPNGEYYAAMWERAVAEQADMVAITSYNEWGEGTQIEPVVAKDGYFDYETEGGPDAYMRLTLQHATSFREAQQAQEQRRSGKRTGEL